MNRYRLFRRGKAGTYYLHDAQTGKQASLRTTRKAEAERLLSLQQETEHTQTINHQIGAIYLNAADPELTKRTWQTVFDEFAKRGGDSTRQRKVRALKQKAFDRIRDKKLVETTSADFLAVLEKGTVSTNMYLRKVHNFAFDLDWLLKRVLARKVWPPVRHKRKQAITREEHGRILEREPNPERRLFYDLLWETGASQGDAARLSDQNIYRQSGILVIHRRKIEHHDPVPARVRIGPRLMEILDQLPKQGALFPYLARVRSGDRATEFKQRCDGLGIKNVTLHSYRYAWAERAFEAGYPERFAMANLGHGSRAVHRAYSKGAKVNCPPLEAFEQQGHASKIVAFPVTGENTRQNTSVENASI